MVAGTPGLSGTLVGTDGAGAGAGAGCGAGAGRGISFGLGILSGFYSRSGTS
jgi:hypothetical protein